MNGSAVTVFDAEDLNGRRCLKCGLLFASDDAIPRTFTVRMASMFDRGETSVLCSADHCPRCDSAQLEPVSLCDCCLEAEALSGGSYCLACETAIDKPQEVSHEAMR